MQPRPAYREQFVQRRLRPDARQATARLAPDAPPPGRVTPLRLVVEAADCPPALQRLGQQAQTLLRILDRERQRQPAPVHAQGVQLPQGLRRRVQLGEAYGLVKQPPPRAERPGQPAEPGPAVVVRLPRRGRSATVKRPTRRYQSRSWRGRQISSANSSNCALWRGVSVFRKARLSSSEAGRILGTATLQATRSHLPTAAAALAAARAVGRRLALRGTSPSCKARRRGGSTGRAVMPPREPTARV